MSWIKNMKIRVKLLLGFGVVLALLIFSAITATFQARKIDSDYSYVLGYPVERLVRAQDINLTVANMRRNVVSGVMYTGDVESVRKFDGEFNSSYSLLTQHINDYIRLVEDDDALDKTGKEDRLKRVYEIRDLCARYQTEVWHTARDIALTGDLTRARSVITDSQQLLTEIVTAVESMAATALVLTDELSIEATEESNKGQVMILTASAVAVLLGIIIAFVIASVISKPISNLLQVVDAVAGGKLNVNIDTTGKDEIAKLAQSSARLVDVFKTLINDLSTMARDHDDGEIDTYLEPKKYAGEYGAVALSVNKMVESHIYVKKTAMATITDMVNGNFAADMEKLPGKKVFVNEAIDNLRSSVKAISGEVDGMIRHSLDGDLSFKIDSRHYQGDWRDLMNGLNEVLNAVAEPIGEVQEVMLKLSNGDFSEMVQGNYKGDFASIKDAVNSTVSAMSSYITEVSQVLGQVSNGDLTQSITRDYVGSFVEIKNSINNITKTLHKTMAEITAASEQVLSGAKQISTSSMDLAKGATMQASSVEELNASIDVINQQTQDNAINAEQANHLSDRSTENAKQGDGEMKLMLDSMAGIKESSNNISKIIKVIEDIAFQTNLLALNAAVEAARAGEHGKGFAVVAEEVRSLASRSSSAAKETTDLIEDSINRVDSGTNTAMSTATSLNTIVSNAAEVSEIIGRITNASREQAEAIGQVSIGLGQISQVVQSNSATSEEAAAAAQELNSQAEMLKQMVSFFKL